MKKMMEFKVVLFLWINIRAFLGLCMREQDREGVGSMLTLHLRELSFKAISTPSILWISGISCPCWPYWQQMLGWNFKGIQTQLSFHPSPPFFSIRKAWQIVSSTWSRSGDISTQTELRWRLWGQTKSKNLFGYFLQWRVFSCGQGVPLGVDKVDVRIGLGSFLKQKP